MSEDSGVWLSISAIARRNGVSKQAISKRLALLPDVSTKPNPDDKRELLVNVGEFDRAVAATADPANTLREIGRAESQAPGEAEDDDPAAGAYVVQRGMREGYLSELARLDLEERVGRLCDKRLAEEHSFDVMRRLRDRFMALPASLSERAIAAKDETALRILLEDGFRAALEEASREFGELFKQVSAER